MIGTGNGNHPPAKVRRRTGSRNGSTAIATQAQELRRHTHQLSLRDQIERNHFLLKRLNAASARLIQALDEGDVYPAIAEIIANLIGSEEVAIFHYDTSHQAFSLAWSWGIDEETLQQFATGVGLIGRAARQGATQFRERVTDIPLRHHENNLTACVVLKSSGEVVGVIPILELLPQKNGLEWTDFELIKFLETYGAVAVQFQKLRENPVAR
jgi:GAF domain-containing protein